MLNLVRLRLWWLAMSLVLLVIGARSASGQSSQRDSAARAPRGKETGRIAGQVIDRATGRPLPEARVIVEGHPDIAQTDLDGRYRTSDLAVGVRSVRVVLIGYATVRQDSVRVVTGQAAVANFSLSTAAVELPEVVSQGAHVVRASTEAGLIAVQQAAPTVMDGISAETMSRSPDSDASDAITRVTGASVVGDKFVYVRGLGERYGNTLLNGTELPSPEPLKKVVPLDLFPASLLQSIVTTKAGRPDRPGDVTGAGVEIQTKDFPESRVLQFSMSQEYNSQTTFKTVRRGGRNGLDFLGIDNGRRMPNGPLPTGAQTQTALGERFAESIRSIWTPTSEAPLNLGFGLNLGGTITGGDSPLGGVLSLNYSSKTDHIADRFYQLTRSSDAAQEPEVGQRYQQTSAAVDWGGILNFSKRLGTSAKLSLRNLYSRTAEELYLSYVGFNRDNSVTDNAHGYQVQYVERDMLQTQLAGEHQVPWLFGSRVEWRGSMALARRDEPENRNLLYKRLSDGSEEFLTSGKSNFFFYRFLNDRLLSGQLDWSIPLSLRTSGDAELKFGAMRRAKTRDFDGHTYDFNTHVSEGDPFLRLPPDLLFTPEHLGSELEFRVTGGPPAPNSVGQEGTDPSYEVTDDITAAYVMVDLPMYQPLRLVGGLRVEWWDLVLYRGSRDQPVGAPVIKRNTDALWSANLTLSLTERMNLRGAIFRSVARPEARELDNAYYQPLGGECGFYGDAGLVRTTVTNADVRWELYPSPGELVTFGGFYKKFAHPIYEQIHFSSATACSIKPDNAESATLYGLEAEFRKRLDFLGFQRFTLGTNFTYVSSEAVIIPVGVPNFVRRAPFVGQSPYLLNMSLSYATDDGGFGGTALLNYFDDRITRYGEIAQPTGEVLIVPDIVERGRTTLDVKLHRRLGRLALSGSGKNLLDSRVKFAQPLIGRELVANTYTSGVSFSLGLGYDF